jgi:NADH:ubiquinone oxidoreductase subunit E
MPILQRLKMQTYWLSTELQDAAEILQINLIEVYEVVSFTPCIIETNRKIHV